MAFSVSSKAQFIDRNSLDFEIEEGFKGQEIYSVGKNGFVLSTKTEREQIRHFKEWKFHLFDTSFTQLYTKSQFISEHLISYQQFATNQVSHHCFLSTNGDYLLNTLTIESFDLTTVKGTFPMKGKVMNMASSGRFAWFSYETKSGWFLISIDWITGDQSVYPISINEVKRKNLRIKKIQIFEEESAILLFVQANKNKMQSTTYIMKLNFEGEMDYMVAVNLHDDENIISTTALKIGPDKYILTGTYSTEKVKSLTEGLFFVKLENQRVSIKKYYNYDDFKGFTDISPINYKYGYFAAIHDLILTDSGYIFIAEMFYPRYTLDINNVPVFIGNSYTHAAICGFDTSGQKKWDETIDFNLNGITIEKEGVLRVLPTKNNKITFAYAEGNYYALNVLDISKMQVSDPEFLMMNKNKPERSNLWFNANILHWYDDCFLFFSTQEKRVKIAGKNRKIEAIFISKER